MRHEGGKETDWRDERERRADDDDETTALAANHFKDTRHTTSETPVLSSSDETRGAREEGRQRGRRVAVQVTQTGKACDARDEPRAMRWEFA